MRVLSVSWNPNLDKTKLKFTEDFLTSDWIVRADILKDLLVDINDLYNATVDEMTNPVLLDSFGHSSNLQITKSEVQEILLAQEEKQAMGVWCNPNESVSEMLHRQSEKN